MSPIDKTLAGIQSECIALRKATGNEVRIEHILDAILDMIDVLAGELRVIGEASRRYDLSRINWDKEDPNGTD